ncbi:MULTISPECIES: TetR/AcrR family transcriptional regulator [unclassified Meiothermus]|uniref:TetR/AcrR family transcriptional regulator n=1 Tax=unclassified Meiothermus TaxID=370471 RepID=UPI000D7C55FA|nr:MULTISPECIES: TetR/AcrR family transcriptional regulator [unclassified Meiothermus]PZA06579.1 TetR/AcrR family transcriptional regulator [Meiothermus sp. Pnk-1]RYM37682.1 TetR/AcrR family transcriptional regulator [Meiothermus sp. PNK-Is4]
MSKAAATRQTRIRQKSVERRERRRQETRQAILEAATQLFEREGYEGFSLRQVAEAIGYTPTTIYLYFKDKEDLLFAVCQQGFTEFTEALGRAYRQNPDPLQRLHALAWAYLEFGLSRPLHYQVMFMQRSDWVTKATDSKGEVQGSNSYTILMNAVIEAMKAGAIRMGDPIETTNLLWSGVHGIVSLALSMRGVIPKWEESEARRLMRNYLEMTDRGLGP